jgi:Uma2 family endonuclease
MKPLKKDATYDDLREVPDNFVAEIFDGELYASPRPSNRHTNAASVLAADLGGPFHRGRNGPGGWVIWVEPELHFGSDVVVPDLAGWHRNRVPDALEGAFMTLAPDWICEVLSPSTETLDRTKKLRVYAREGVPHAWLLDPLEQTLEVLVLDSSRWLPLVTHEGDAQVRVPPFDAIVLELAALWR